MEMALRAPSYDAFIEYARGLHIDWVKGKFRGSKPDVHELLRAARAIAGTDVDLVAVDMPVAEFERPGVLAAGEQADH